MVSQPLADSSNKSLPLITTYRNIFNDYFDLYDRVSIIKCFVKKITNLIILKNGKGYLPFYNPLLSTARLQETSQLYSDLIMYV